MVEDSVDYNSLKATLELTDGNLASHIKALEKEEYIKIEKSFLGKKPNTTYQITKRGKLAFDAHLNALEKMINQVQPTKKIKK
jgi:DNA-binding MarR family transcriptional regulator